MTSPLMLPKGPPKLSTGGRMRGAVATQNSRMIKLNHLKRMFINLFCVNKLCCMTSSFSHVFSFSCLFPQLNHSNKNLNKLYNSKKYPH